MVICIGSLSLERQLYNNTARSASKPNTLPAAISSQPSTHVYLLSTPERQRPSCAVNRKNIATPAPLLLLQQLAALSLSLLTHGVDANSGSEHRASTCIVIRYSHLLGSSTFRIYTTHTQNVSERRISERLAQWRTPQRCCQWHRCRWRRCRYRCCRCHTLAAVLTLAF